MREETFSRRLLRRWAGPTVELYRWRPGGRFRLRTNFGDELGPVVVRHMLRQHGLSPLSRGRDVRLLTVGSVLHQARDNDVVWGSGRNGRITDAEHCFSRLDVRAVRGPLTGAFLAARGIHVPEVYGDPALLLPRFHTPEGAGRKAETRGGIVLVPHLFDLPRLGALRMAGVDRIVSPEWHWRRCVQAIASARLVVSSSLHGLIVAEAYGVPARRIDLGGDEPDFKYEDYYRGTGRNGHRPAKCLEEALALGGEAPAQFDPEKLIDAFPYDLWRQHQASAPVDGKPSARTG